jgi:hypothetical protein
MAFAAMYLARIPVRKISAIIHIVGSSRYPPCPLMLPRGLGHTLKYVCVQRLVYGSPAEAAIDLGFDAGQVSDAVRGTATWQETNAVVKRIYHPEVAFLFWHTRKRVQLY